jgi:UDP-GlcNAc:undecaprenyl-phosphate GlcNAc-1-phosphate transferase
LLTGVALVVATINAVNLFDGLDGLVGASGAVAALGAAALAAQRGLDGSFGTILAAALAGFLALNWHRARVFLGDNGSYAVGVFLVYGVLIASPDGIGTGLAIALLVLGVFGLDLVATVVRRRLAGRSLFTGDRSHLYDQLHDRGMSIRRVALTSAAAQAGFGAAAIGLDALDLGAWSWLMLAGLAMALLVGLAAGGFLRPGQVD